MTMLIRATALTLALAAATASPVLANTGTGTGTAKLLFPITVSESSSLDFGSVVPSTSTTGYVTIEPENSRSECSVTSCTGSFAPGNFTVTGSANTVLAISHAGVSSNPTTFTLTSGANSMTFGLILHTPTITLSSLGIGSFDIGGRILVPANQPEGDYSGTYDVTVDYQ